MNILKSIPNSIFPRFTKVGLMNIPIIKGVFLVKNDRGLHTRPSTEIVRLATTFKSEIRLRYQKIDVNAKSLLGILMLAAVRGAKIKIIAKGKDASEAVKALEELADSNFNIDY